MALTPDQLRTARAAVEQFARDDFDAYARNQRVTAELSYLPGSPLPPEEWPAGVRHDYHGDFNAWAGDPDSGPGKLYVRRLGPDCGSAILMLVIGIEHHHGALRLFSPDGEILSSGYHKAAFVAWTSTEELRALLLQDRRVPYELMPTTSPIQWLPCGPEQTSLGGRFIISGQPGSGAFFFTDFRFDHEAEFASEEEAKASAERRLGLTSDDAE